MPTRTVTATKMIFFGLIALKPNDQRSHAGPMTSSTQRDGLPALADAAGWVTSCSLKKSDPIRLGDFASSQTRDQLRHFRILELSVSGILGTDVHIGDVVMKIAEQILKPRRLQGRKSGERVESILAPNLATLQMGEEDAELFRIVVHRLHPTVCLGQIHGFVNFAKTNSPGQTFGRKRRFACRRRDPGKQGNLSFHISEKVAKTKQANSASEQRTRGKVGKRRSEGVQCATDAESRRRLQHAGSPLACFSL